MVSRGSGMTIGKSRNGQPWVGGDHWKVAQWSAAGQYPHARIARGAICFFYSVLHNQTVLIFSEITNKYFLNKWSISKVFRSRLFTHESMPAIKPHRERHRTKD